MVTLALETSTPRGSVAVHDGARLLWSESFTADRGTSSLLFPLLERALAECPRPQQIAVGLGPGSYAGIRIGIAAAMGLDLALGTRLVGVPSVAAFDVKDEEYLAIGDARRETYYWTRVQRGECLEGPILLTEAEIRARLGTETLPVYATALLPLAPAAAVAFPIAEQIAEFAARGRGITSTGALEPIYLREPHITKPRMATAPPP